MHFLRDTGTCYILIGTAAALAFSGATAQSQSVSATSDSTPPPALEPAWPGIWEHAVGEGFRPGTQTFSLQVGAVGGARIFGSRQQHDLALASISYGRVISPVKGEGHWWHGNWELRGELFSGAQFSPDVQPLVGLTPHLRYDFATGTRWVPYLDGGAGVTATGIGPPDLSNTFEFNLQAGPGVHYFLRDNLALTADVRFLHMSCAGISHPNLGLNGFMGYLGLTWFW